MKRKVIFNLAMSLDGFILDENGKYDWIKGDGDISLNTETSFDFSEFIKSIDTIIMGRTSFIDIGIEDYKNKSIVVATSKDIEDYDNVKFIKNDIVNYVNLLKNESGKNIWLFGGSKLTDYFLKSNVIDEYIIGIVPVILGSGTPLFYKNNLKTELHLDNYYTDQGIVILKYSRRSKLVD